MARLLMPEIFGVMLIATTVSVVLHLLSDVGLRQNIVQSPRGDDPVFLNTAWTVQILRGVVLFASTLLIAGFTWFAQVITAFSEATRVNDSAQLRALYYRIRLVVDLALLFVCGLFLIASPFIISCLYDERYAQVGSMMAILPLSFFTLRYGVAHQLWLALGLTKYQAMDNIIRVVSLWGLLSLLLALGVVVGRNPAKVICTIEELIKKSRSVAPLIRGWTPSGSAAGGGDPEFEPALVAMRVQHFFGEKPND